MTRIGKLGYINDVKNIVGQGSYGTVFSGFYLMSESSKPIPVAVKRVLRTYVDDGSIEREVALMKTAGDNLNILSCVHTEMNDDFL